MSDHDDHEEIAAVQRDYEAEYGPEVAEEQGQLHGLDLPDPVGQMRTNLGEWHDRLSRALAYPDPVVLAVAAERIRDRIADLLTDWPRPAADLVIDPPSPARPAVSQAPLNVEPPGPHMPEAERLALLTESLAGVNLGDYDARILRWLARADTPTVRAVASLIGRARIVAPAGLEITRARCGAHLEIGYPVEFHVVADDAPGRARRNRPEGTP